MVMSFVLVHASVHASEGSQGSATFWADMESLLRKCVVQRSNQEPLTSQCSEIKVSRLGDTARVGRYFVTMVESPLSDGGDLYDVYVETFDGELVASRKNVAAFGDILLALAGGENFFTSQNN